MVFNKIIRNEKAFGNIADSLSKKRYSLKEIEIYNNESDVAHDGHTFAQEPYNVINISNIQFEKGTDFIKTLEKYLTDRYNRRIAVNTIQQLCSYSSSLIIKFKNEKDEVANLLNFTNSEISLMYYRDQKGKLQKFERIDLNGKVIETVISGENLFKGLLKKLFRKNN